MLADRRKFKRRQAALQQRLKSGKPIDKGLHTLEADIQTSQQRLMTRQQNLLHPEYPPELPVSTRRDEIAEAITQHQVVVIAGETGSGKTTQIPKICLQIGRGVAGMIGHTQPRRLAARSVAARIAEELNTPLGGTVGYKIRFSDRVSSDSYIKLLTDGMLLAEVQGDPLLEQYDTIIVDEAHERSLNIDFLLGYLKQLLPKRPELKLIITSATINTDRFSEFFDGAPVIEVSGRTYPVEQRYRPLLDNDDDSRDNAISEAIISAVDELARTDPLGDILIFLAGEREIRETAEALHKHHMANTEVLPLFSRLSATEQDRIFRSHTGRRIILATNVAETSLTVPGIRFVIDPGFARISRYSHRTKVQRLPTEAISQASANQRAGRCGRVSAGVCIRLYDEEDYLGRAEFTDPEIQRTNLASVILQMSALGLGKVEAFPFMDPPDSRYINDGFRILHELGAVDDCRQLTSIGRKLVRLPVDPRIGRMLLAADSERSLTEVLVITAALSVRDPRERPVEAQAKADEAHSRLRDDTSDFLSFLKVWDFYNQQARHLSQNKLRKLCREHFLSYMRIREWHDIHKQLKTLAKDMGLQPNDEAADADAIHRAILTGLLGNIACLLDKQQSEKDRNKANSLPYTGARNNRLSIFPGSALFKKKPKWIMAAELVETSKLYARSVAAIKPEWLEPLAEHLLKRSYFEPHWQKRSAQVGAYEQISLYGLILVDRRRINYGPMDPELSRELFIRHALVAGEFNTPAPFFKHNRELIDDIESLEAKSRRRDVLVDEQILFEFYEQRIPSAIYSGKTFEKWYQQAIAKSPRLLHLQREDLMHHEAETVTETQFPDTLQLGSLRLPLEYHFEPQHPADGVTLVVPIEALGQLDPLRLEWLVPGLLQQKIIAIIKSLPKQLRRNFVPAVNYAEACLQTLEPESRSLNDAMAEQLYKMTGIRVDDNDWQSQDLPVHLLMNFRIRDEGGKILTEGRNLPHLQNILADKTRQSLALHPMAELERDDITRWDFGTLAEVVEQESHGLVLQAFPALVDNKKSVAIKLFESQTQANTEMQAGMRRLFMLQLSDKIKYLKKNIPGLKQMCLFYSPVGQCEELTDDILCAAFDRVFLQQSLPRDEQTFVERCQQDANQLIGVTNTLVKQVADTLKEYHHLQKIIKGQLAPHQLHAVSDIQAQLDEMVYHRFVANTPATWLPHLPRFIQAIIVRLEKLDANPQRDRQHMIDIKNLYQSYEEALRKATKINVPHGPPPESLQEVRWLIEELRVSLFAQTLKTSTSVSVQRLEKRLNKTTP